MTEPESRKRGWTFYVPLGAVLVVFTLMFVLPGFVAGAYCRTSGDVDTLVNLSFFGFAGRPDLKSTPLRIFLIPACFLAESSRTLAAFYTKQFHLIAPRSPVLVQ